MKFLILVFFSSLIWATSPTSTGSNIVVPEQDVNGSYLGNQVFSTGATMQMTAEVSFDVLASHQATGMVDLNSASGSPVYVGQLNVYATDIKNKINDIEANGGSVRKLNCSLIKTTPGESDTLTHSTFSLTVPEQGFDCELYYDGLDYKIRMKALTIVAIENYVGPSAHITFQKGDNDGFIATKSHRVSDVMMVNDTYNPSTDSDSDIFTKNNSQNSAINDHLILSETVDSASSALLLRFEFDLSELRSDTVNGLATSAFSGNEIEILWEYNGL